jgi:surface carbohydrate biosynthesis protein (TIGR04326 family)
MNSNISRRVFEYVHSAVSTLLQYNLMESAINMLPRQDKGIYLQENQAWEMGMIHAWKSAGHGKLVGSIHSTVRYWDLRYFYCTHSYYKKGIEALPMPEVAPVIKALFCSCFFIV